MTQAQDAERAGLDPAGGLRFPAPWHRLALEARRTGRNYRLSAMTSALAAAVRAGQWVGGGLHGLPGQALGLVAAVPVSVLLAYRWRARARWYARTPAWWLRLHEAPPILPLPRVAAWLDRPVSWQACAAAAAVLVAAVVVALAVR